MSAELARVVGLLDDAPSSPLGIPSRSPHTPIPVDAQLSERVVRGDRNQLETFAFGGFIVLFLYLMLILGGFPAARRRELSFTFLRAHIRMDSISIVARLW